MSPSGGEGAACRGRDDVPGRSGLFRNVAGGRGKTFEKEDADGAEDDARERRGQVFRSEQSQGQRHLLRGVRGGGDGLLQEEYLQSRSSPARMAIPPQRGASRGQRQQNRAARE